jgi:hypothetical protein
MFAKSRNIRRMMPALSKDFCQVCLVGLLLLSGRCVAQSWGSVRAGYDYLITKGSNGDWTSTNGWYVLPTFNINKQIGVFADFTNFYGSGKISTEPLLARCTRSVTNRGIRLSSLPASVRSGLLTREV